MNKLILTPLLIFSIYISKGQGTFSPPFHSRAEEDSAYKRGGYADNGEWIPLTYKPTSFFYSGLKSKPDSTPDFRTIVFLMQQNIELSERLDRTEKRSQYLENELHPPTRPYGALPDYLNDLFERVAARSSPLLIHRSQ